MGKPTSIDDGMASANKIREVLHRNAKAYHSMGVANPEDTVLLGQPKASVEHTKKADFLAFTFDPIFFQLQKSLQSSFSAINHIPKMWWYQLPQCRLPKSERAGKNRRRWYNRTQSSSSFSSVNRSADRSVGEGREELKSDARSLNRLSRAESESLLAAVMLNDKNKSGLRSLGDSPDLGWQVYERTTVELEGAASLKIVPDHHTEFLTTHIPPGLQGGKLPNNHSRGSYIGKVLQPPDEEAKPVKLDVMMKRDPQFNNSASSVMWKRVNAEVSHPYSYFVEEDTVGRLGPVCGGNLSRVFANKNKKEKVTGSAEEPTLSCPSWAVLRKEMAKALRVPEERMKELKKEA
ncbi:hypothetical protein CLF_104001 [Clonorchis sinensis]|uniref:Uncharacterized protein n=1 Tax=Clonorchis sinensis TaxID=79923 RepID=G7YAS0_CLOSI|nr:hypothetical protein CLF_104001 [Clonorchis sinensis]